VVPGCSDIVATRVGLIDHLGQHDFETRKSNKRVLVEYGFSVNEWHGYLQAKYICSIQGCPLEQMMRLLCLAICQILTRPSCPCPIPSCGGTSKTGCHSPGIARAHDYVTRDRFWRELQAHRQYVSCGTVLCPICDHEIIDVTLLKVRAHWQNITMNNVFKLRSTYGGRCVRIGTRETTVL